jgi:hypothetical protein
MRLTFRVVVALGASVVLVGTAVAKEMTSVVTEETASVGPEAAEVLLSSVEDTVLVGTRAAMVLLDASQPADRQITPRKSAPAAAKARPNATGHAKAARGTN